MDISRLIGSTLLEVRHNDDLYLRTSAGTFHFQAYGDCCSNAYVSDIPGAASVLGATITGLEEKDATATDDSDGDGGYRQITFYTFKTTAGQMDVILHVDHNGYYGGHLENPVLVDSFPTGAHVPEC